MLLLSAMVILLLSGHFLAQDDTNLTPNYCPRMGFTYWSNLTLTCTYIQICNPQTVPTYLWYLQLANKTRVPIGRNPSLINTFENDTEVTLSLTNNTEDSCNAGEVIEYSLTIENTRRSIDGLVVTCGVRENDNNTELSNSTVLYLKSQITTYTTFKRTVSPGSSTKISCTGQRFPDRVVSNRWRLKRPSKDNISVVDLIENSLQADQFFKETGVTLELNTSSDTCKYDEFVNYTLTIRNINQNVDGMLITCGAIDRSSLTNNHDEWFADHSVELVLQAPVSTNSTFETSVSDGGNFTLSCTRSCGLHIFDVWSLQLEDSDTPFNVTGKDQQEKYNFENETGVTLILTNTENEKGCDENVAQYSLIIRNISRRMEGLIVRCGILKNDTQDMWYAPHSVRLKIDKTAQLEAAIVAGQEDCKRKGNTIGVTVGILSLVLCTLLVLSLIYIIIFCRCLAMKRKL